MKKLQAQIFRGRDDGIICFALKCPMIPFYRDKLGKMPSCIAGKYVPKEKGAIVLPNGNAIGKTPEMVFEPVAVCPNYLPGSMRKGAGEQDFEIGCGFTNIEDIEGDAGKKKVF